jgi:hypothetical protein
MFKASFPFVQLSRQETPFRTAVECVLGSGIQPRLEPFWSALPLSLPSRVDSAGLLQR